MGRVETQKYHQIPAVLRHPGLRSRAEILHFRVALRETSPNISNAAFAGRLRAILDADLHRQQQGPERAPGLLFGDGDVRISRSRAGRTAAASRAAE